MEITFLGGAEEVGRLSILVDYKGSRFLVDYGITPSKPPKYPIEAPKVDFLLLTHAHIDHSGLVPWLCSKYSPDVYATPPTRDLSELLARDTCKVSSIEGYGIPYKKADIDSMKDRFIDIAYNKSIDVGDMRLSFSDSGHVPGSTMFLVDDILFTGDFNSTSTNLLKKAEPVKCRTLFMESTYAGREHPDRAGQIKKFLNGVEETVSNGGKVIVPAFALSRAQEILTILNKQGYEVWLDGMARAIARLFQKMPDYLNIKELNAALGATKFVRSNGDRRRALQGDVIVTPSGMLEGGPALYYTKNLNNKKNSIYLTGYQVAETNGRMLLNKGKLDFQGVPENISCKVELFDFSAHASHNQLVDFARACNPETIVLCHGENRRLLAKDLNEFELILPDNGKKFEC